MTDPKQEQPRTEFLTARQLAAALQVSEATVRRLQRAGRIPYVRITGRIVRFHLRDVKQALSRSRAKPSSEAQPEAALARPDSAETQLTFDDLLSGTIH
jgi:excisionase family DNA binding protein